VPFSDFIRQWWEKLSESEKHHKLESYLPEKLKEIRPQQKSLPSSKLGDYDLVQEFQNLNAMYFDNKLIQPKFCLLYTSDAADEEDSVDLGGRLIIT